MATITHADFVQSIADGFQFISIYHPADYIRALAKAYTREQSPAAKDAIAQILVNSRMAYEGHRPICQDTGICVVYLKVGMDVRWETKVSLQAMVDEGVRRAYLDPANKLRASMVADPAGKRTNTRDNTPAVVHVELVPGGTVEVYLAAKGGGSENKSRFAMLNPSDSVVDWVVTQVPTMGGDWCPPGMLGIGIGGSPEKALVMAKLCLLTSPIDMHELRARGPRTRAEELRIEIFDKVNALGIGAQGLGGLSTVLDVKVVDFPTHAASLPVGMVPNCAATRHVHFTLDGSGPATLTRPAFEDWPKLEYVPSPDAVRLDLDTLTKDKLAGLRAGQRVLLNGKMLTGRDAAHKRMVDMLAKGEKLPVDLTNRVIYYVGPVDPIAGEVVGPAGPTTARRMDKFTETVLARTGLIGMVGKSERGPEGIAAIQKHKACYFIAIGGAAFLVSKAIKASRVVAFEDLGMEAIYEFEVRDMPVTVAVDSTGVSVHETGPREWRSRIAQIPIVSV